MTWQPIETAPHGEPVLVMYPRDAAGAVLEVYGKHNITTAIRYEANEQYKGSFPGWVPLRLESHGCGCCGGRDPDPIAWMPLSDLEPKP